MSRHLTTWVTAMVLAAGLPVVTHGEIIDRVVAILPGQILTLSDVEGAIDLGLIEAPVASRRLESALMALIDRVLMLNEVRRVVPPEPADAAVEARVAEMKRRIATRGDLAQTLAARGLNEDMLRIHAADDLRLSAYLDERFSAASQPTEQEILQAGEASRARLIDERRRILVSAWTAELRRRADVTILLSPD